MPKRKKSAKVEKNKSTQTNGLNVQNECKKEKETKLTQANRLNKLIPSSQEINEEETTEEVKENITIEQVNEMFRNKTCEEVLDMIRVQVEAKFNKIWEFNYNNLKSDKSYHLNYWVNLDGFKVYIDEPF